MRILYDSKRILQILCSPDPGELQVRAGFTGEEWKGSKASGRNMRYERLAGNAQIPLPERTRLNYLQFVISRERNGLAAATLLHCNAPVKVNRYIKSSFGDKFVSTKRKIGGYLTHEGQVAATVSKWVPPGSFFDQDDDGCYGVLVETGSRHGTMPYVLDKDRIDFNLMLQRHKSIVEAIVNGAIERAVRKTWIDSLPDLVLRISV